MGPDGRPSEPPIGTVLASSAKAVSRAFDAALAQAGGSRSTWLVLLALKRTPQASQRELADAVDIQGATLTHHLDAMQADGLLRRRPAEGDRRAHIVELTETGEETFDRLRRAARAFDRRLCDGLAADELDALRATLARLRGNVTTAAVPTADRRSR